MPERRILRHIDHPVEGEMVCAELMWSPTHDDIIAYRNAGVGNDGCPVEDDIGVVRALVYNIVPSLALWALIFWAVSRLI